MEVCYPRYFTWLIELEVEFGVPSPPHLMK